MLQFDEFVLSLQGKEVQEDGRGWQSLIPEDT